jgi:hypothetical protein
VSRQEKERMKEALLSILIYFGQVEPTPIRLEGKQLHLMEASPFKSFAFLRKWFGLNKKMEEIH